MMPSPRAIALIEQFEIGSPSDYIPRPCWPGGASGITIGIGYDLGYTTLAQIEADWQVLPRSTIIRLQSYAGCTGQAANRLFAGSQDIVIPYATAKQVFEAIDVPRASAQTVAAFPNCNQLSADSFGALVSLVFNRGAGMSDTSPGNRQEMRDIRDAMQAENFDLVPGLIRSMKRLWPNVPGLQSRRDAEADLFTTGLHPSVA